jgi:hypothetical protein
MDLRHVVCETRRSSGLVSGVKVELYPIWLVLLNDHPNLLCIVDGSFLAYMQSTYGVYLLFLHEYAEYFSVQGQL